MHCNGCVQRVSQAIQKVEGARIDEIHISSAVISVDPKREEAVLEAIRKAGYEPRKSE